MKAILVIDVEEYGDYYVDVYRKDENDSFEGRYYLKPLPETKDVGYPNDKYDVGFGDGWDACLKEIEK